MRYQLHSESDLDKGTLKRGKADKIAVCHEGSETEEVKLISVSGNSNHLGNPAHGHEDIVDFEADPDSG